jgi:hypothetical protein
MIDNLLWSYSDWLKRAGGFIGVVKRKLKEGEIDV